MGKPKRQKQWPPIYRLTHRRGQVGYQVDLGIVEKKRKRLTFPTKVEAVTYPHAGLIPSRKTLYGTAVFSLSLHSRSVATDNRCLGTKCNFDVVNQRHRLHFAIHHEPCFTCTNSPAPVVVNGRTQLPIQFPAHSSFTG